MEILRVENLTKIYGKDTTKVVAGVWQLAI